jgi:hypothetical protein
MTEVMDKTWNLYEAEKAAGNAESADMISDAYTVLDMIDMNSVEEEFAWHTYYGIGKAVTKEMLRGEETNTVKAYRMLEEAMVEAGLLEADEEPEEEPEEEMDYTNDAQHWDEWAADQRYDMYRDMALMGYEY